MNNYDADNIEIYKETFNCDIEIAFFKYTNIIEDFFIGSKKFEKYEHYRYILIKGIENIYHVFNMLLFYSKNIDFTHYHSQRTFLYYCEFVEQVKDDNNNLLNLSIKDATMFIYKKILYSVKKNVHSISDIEEKNILTLDKIIMLYNNLLSNSIISNNHSIDLFNKSIVKNIFKNHFNEIVMHIDVIMVCNDVMLSKIRSNEKIIQLYKLIIKYIKKYEIKTINTVDIENINMLPNNKIIKRLFKLSVL